MLPISKVHVLTPEDMDVHAFPWDHYHGFQRFARRAYLEPHEPAYHFCRYAHKHRAGHPELATVAYVEGLCGYFGPGEINEGDQNIAYTAWNLYEGRHTQFTMLSLFPEQDRAPTFIPLIIIPAQHILQIRGYKRAFTQRALTFMENYEGDPQSLNKHGQCIVANGQDWEWNHWRNVVHLCDHNAGLFPNNEIWEERWPRSDT